MTRVRLRTYAPMHRRSLKIRTAEPDFRAVYRLVDQRSDGRCEVVVGGSRCARRGTDHHHLFKPRRSHHTVGEIVHVCRRCHDRMTWPFQRGRLCYLGGVYLSQDRQRFFFAIRSASDKWAARQPKAGP
jgi:hypothetical protein